MSLYKFKYQNWIVLFVLVLPLVVDSCSGKPVKKVEEGRPKQVESGVNRKYPKFEFTKELHKFGKISAGEIGICDFYFKNVGESNLIIKNIESDCGCAEFKFQKRPIKVGEESKITIEFNSKGRNGKQYKVITIYSNTLQKKKKLIITATVE